MKRILLILGEIIFTENEDGTPKQAEILDVTITLYVDEDKADLLGDCLISQGVAVSYVIPKLYKGQIIFNC